MADQVINIQLTVDGGGQLTKATTDVNKLTGAVDKNTSGKKKNAKANEEVIKGQKGIHQSNLSTAKGFSKMNQMLGSGGSSGLVAAYATLAANVFAATAAFNALRQAAQVQTLIDGFTKLAAQSGRTATIVAENMREITGGGLSMEQALRASALALSSGFSTSQLNELTEVAKNASIALGRNLADSTDRLIRGVAKLEPEILDELGIMVRLDTAVEKYAAALGKSATSLTASITFHSSENTPPSCL